MAVTTSTARYTTSEPGTGNPVDGYVTMLTESRQDAVSALVAMAEAAASGAGQESSSGDAGRPWSTSCTTR